MIQNVSLTLSFTGLLPAYFPRLGKDDNGKQLVTQCQLLRRCLTDRTTVVAEHVDKANGRFDSAYLWLIYLPFDVDSH